jgi:hypothetical protein
VVSSSRAETTSQRPQTSSNTLSTHPNNPTVSPSNNQQPAPSTEANNPTQTSVVVASSVTQQVIYKTTLPNGAATTVTSVTVIPAQGFGFDTTGGSATKTSPGNAGLQTGAATRERSGINVALLGALGMAAAVAL